MIVRIDTTNVTRGREFSILARDPNGEEVRVYALDPLSGEIVPLDISPEATTNPDYIRYASVAPSIDGFLLVRVGRQKVVKKIGFPQPSFVIGYKEGYTVPYAALDGDGNEIVSGELLSAVDVFYYTTLPEECAIVKALGKEFMVNKNLLKMNYEVFIDGGTLGSTINDATLSDAELPDVTLSDADLPEAELDSTMPEVTIKEL